MKRQLTFEFADTEIQAARLTARLNTKRPKTAKAHYLPWQSLDGTENKFIVWFYA